MTGLEGSWAERRGLIRGFRENLTTPLLGFPWAVVLVFGPKWSTLWPKGSSLCSVASVSSSLLRMMVWAGARAVEVAVFLPSLLCSRWMWNLRCPFRLKLRRGKSWHEVAPPGVYMKAPLLLAISGLTAAHRGGMRRASHWCVLACAALDPSCSWRRSYIDCTGGASGWSAVPCEPTQGRDQAPVGQHERQQVFIETKTHVDQKPGPEIGSGLPQRKPEAAP